MDNLKKRERPNFYRKASRIPAGLLFAFLLAVSSCGDSDTSKALEEKPAPSEPKPIPPPTYNVLLISLAKLSIFGLVSVEYP